MIYCSSLSGKLLCEECAHQRATSPDTPASYGDGPHGLLEIECDEEVERSLCAACGQPLQPEIRISRRELYRMAGSPGVARFTEAWVSLEDMLSQFETEFRIWNADRDTLIMFTLPPIGDKPTKVTAVSGNEREGTARPVLDRKPASLIINSVRGQQTVFALQGSAFDRLIPAGCRFTLVIE